MFNGGLADCEKVPNEASNIYSVILKSKYEMDSLQFLAGGGYNVFCA